MIKLTKEEIELVKAGELNPAEIEKYRAEHPVPGDKVSILQNDIPTIKDVSRPVFNDELSKTKQDIRDQNVLYLNAIKKNKDLYKAIEDSRKEKEMLRNKIAELRIKKKKLMGK
jgi:hypothetical protein